MLLGSKMGHAWVCVVPPGSERVPVTGSSHSLAVVKLGLGLGLLSLLWIKPLLCGWWWSLALVRIPPEAREAFLSLESLPVDSGCCWERYKCWCQCRWLWPFIPNWPAFFSPPQPRHFFRGRRDPSHPSWALKVSAG